MRYSIFLAGLCLSLSACVHRLSSEMDAWVGKDESALVSEWGAPSRAMALSNGSKVLTWVTAYNSADDGKPPEITDCVRSFTLAADRVVSWSAHGCPRLYVRR